MHHLMEIAGKAVFLLLLLSVAATPGCATWQRGPSDRPVQADMEIYVRSVTARNAWAKLAVFPFDAPAGAEAAAESATASYRAMLLQRQAFREIVAIEQPARSDAEALWYARSLGCDLALRPSVLSLLDGTGAMPTRIEVRIRILDARSERVLWDLKQVGSSEPGPDVDLAWWTISGEPARRYPVLAQRLADQFVAFLTQPPKEE